MLRSRLVFDRQMDFPRSEIDTVISLARKIHLAIKSSSDLTQPLMNLSG